MKMMKMVWREWCCFSHGPMLQISIQWPPSFKVLSVLEACKLTNPMLNVRSSCLPQKSKQFIRRFGGGGADGITVIAFQRLWWACRKLGETLIDFNDRPRSCRVVFFCRLEQQCECSQSSTWLLLIFAHAWWATYNSNIMSGVQRCLCLSILCDTYVYLCDINDNFTYYGSYCTLFLIIITIIFLIIKPTQPTFKSDPSCWPCTTLRMAICSRSFRPSSTILRAVY